jgi:RNA polymerase sigma-70 factor (ECF subfamily)
MVAVMQSSEAPTKAEFHAAIARRSGHWYSACLRITHDEDMAADAVQDALLSAWNKREQFDGGSQLETWIHRIAINAALQLIRKHRPERAQPLDMEIADHSPSPPEIEADAQLESTLSGALRQLTEVERVCFVLKHLEQWRIREIAEELDASDGTVKQALFRGVRKLRTSMADLRNQHDE